MLTKLDVRVNVTWTLLFCLKFRTKQVGSNVRYVILTFDVILLCIFKKMNVNIANQIICDKKIF